MKGVPRVLLIAALAGVVSFAASYILGRNEAARRAAEEGRSLEWLRVEFRLDPVQFAAIDRMHSEYSRSCDEHCQRILAAKDRKAPPAEIDALAAECVASMTAHFRRVAALMPAGQGQRYLDLVLPKIAAYDHREAPSLKVN